MKLASQIVGADPDGVGSELLRTTVDTTASDMKRYRSLVSILVLLATIVFAAWQYYDIAREHFPVYVAVSLGLAWAGLVWLWLVPKLARCLANSAWGLTC